MKPFTLEWWMEIHKRAIYQAHLEVTDNKMRYYIDVANWIANRVTEKYGEKS